jgi:hypothetical protein
MSDSGRASTAPDRDTGFGGLASDSALLSWERVSIKLTGFIPRLPWAFSLLPM